MVKGDYAIGDNISQTIYSQYNLTTQIVPITTISFCIICLQSHRASAGLAAVITATSFIIIFVKVDGLTEVKHCFFVIYLFLLEPIYTYLVYDYVQTIYSNLTSLINITDLHITFLY